MKMHNPAHPGELLVGWLDDLDVSVTAFAAHIGISRKPRLVSARGLVHAGASRLLGANVGTGG